jgi:hypothetical protein
VEARSERLKEKVERLRDQMRWLQAMEAKVAASPDGQVSLTDPDARSMATTGSLPDPGGLRRAVGRRLPG